MDTDIHRLPVNFPFIINTDKYPALNTVIKKGTPMIQVIPFKRDSWVMSIEKQKDKSYSSEIIKFFTSLIDRYKNNVWQKKKWVKKYIKIIDNVMPIEDIANLVKFVKKVDYKHAQVGADASVRPDLERFMIMV